MTAPELKRLKVTLFGNHSQNVTYGFDEDPNGKYVRFADVEAYTQAAIAAAMMGAMKACNDQADIFLSPEYAGDDPKHSFAERFACRQCAEAIEEIIPTDALAALEEIKRQAFADGAAAKVLQIVTTNNQSELDTMLAEAEKRVREDVAAWLDTLRDDITPKGAAILLRKGGAA